MKQDEGQHEEAKESKGEEECSKMRRRRTTAINGHWTIEAEMDHNQVKFHVSWVAMIEFALSRKRELSLSKSPSQNCLWNYQRKRQKQNLCEDGQSKFATQFGD